MAGFQRRGALDDQFLQMMVVPLQFHFGLLAIGDIEDHRDRVAGLAQRIAHQRGGRQHPDDLAVLADVALLSRIFVDLPSHHALVFPGVVLAIIRMGDLQEGALLQLVGVVAGHFTQPLVDAQESARGRIGLRLAGAGQFKHGAVFIGAGAHGLLGDLLLAHIAGEAAAVDEPAMLPQHVGIQQRVLDGSVIAAQPHRIIDQGFAAREPLQQIGHDVLVSVELGQRMPDVLLRGIAQHLELRLVGAEDDAVGADPMHADGGVLEKVVEIRLAAPQGNLHVAAANELRHVVPDRRHGVLQGLVRIHHAAGEEFDHAEEFPARTDRKCQPALQTAFGGGLKPGEILVLLQVFNGGGPARGPDAPG